MIKIIKTKLTVEYNSTDTTGRYGHGFTISIEFLLDVNDIQYYLKCHKNDYTTFEEYPFQDMRFRDNDKLSDICLYYLNFLQTLK